MLSGRGLCDELITRPEESYRLWCVVLCDLKQQKPRECWGQDPVGGATAPRENKSVTLHINTKIKLFKNIKIKRALRCYLRSNT